MNGRRCFANVNCAIRIPVHIIGTTNKIVRETTTRVLASLTPREEVGQQFSVTGERIRQIEAKALRKLKHP